MRIPEEILKKYWGYSEFLHPQKEIIDSVLAGNDTLAILPTGGGKSICYQLPAMVLDGITLVISPLIALMQDQIQNLNTRGIPAAAISSQLNRDEIALTVTRCALGEIRLLYIAPERLQSRFFREVIQNLPIRLIAVDEAHCISQWGFDFRPSYLKINLVREIFPNVNVLALTATAPAQTADEIISALEMKDAQVFKKSLKRENLAYKVIYSQNELDDLVHRLKRLPGPGIVFVRSRKQTFEVARFLAEAGFNAQYFHAKLPKEEKTKRQQIWTESTDQIMVSTNAFGMGIDKPDVRTVIHLNLPESLEAYVQEAGRAGRDGKHSEAILFVQPHEVEDMEAIFKASLPNRKEFEQIEKSFYNFFEIGENERPIERRELDYFEFVRRFNLDKKKTEKVLSFLERKEVISLKDRSAHSVVRVYSNPKSVRFSKSIQYRILEILVRKYPGIMTDEQRISEFGIASELQKTSGKIKKQLQKMSDSGYIYYRRNDVLTVKFKRPRESDYIKNILWKEFEKYQIVRWKRLQDIIYYATQKDVCREKLILRYFGENPKEKCGQCDLCLNKTEEMKLSDILDFMGDESKTITEIIDHFLKFKKETITEAVEKLIDEGMIANTGIDSYKRI